MPLEFPQLPKNGTQDEINSAYGLRYMIREKKLKREPTPVPIPEGIAKLERSTRGPQVSESDVWNLGLRHQQREIFTPFCEDFAQRVDQIPEEKILGMYQNIPRAENLPYIDWNELTYQLAALDLEKWKDETNFQRDLADPKISENHKQHILRFLKERAEAVTNNKPFPILSAATNDQVYFLRLVEENTRPTKHAEYHVLNEAEGYFEQYMWNKLDVPDITSSIQFIALPVGEYGVELTELLVDTTYILTQLANELMFEDSETMLSDTTPVHSYREPTETSGSSMGDSTVRDILIGHTSRTDPLTSLHEGIVTIGQEMSFLTPELIPGLSDPIQTVNTLIKSHLPNTIAMRVPIGILGPLTLAGQYIPEVVSYDEQSGSVALTENFNQIIDPLLAAYREKRRLMALEKRGYETGEGCPVGSKKRGYMRTGIQATADAFLRVFNILANAKKQSI